MLQPGRNANAEDYRYGFNGKEKDDEVSGSGNSYEYGFRIYNPRIAKFLSVDPLTKSYPELTPYQFASNTPIWAIDLDGLEAFFIHGTNHGADVWQENILLDTKEAILELVNYKTVDDDFSWKVMTSEIKKVKKSGKVKLEHNKLLNYQFNDLDNRIEASDLLVDYIVSYREFYKTKDEEITLIGYSHGGNVSIMAAQKLFDKYGIIVNIVTVNTPAYNGEADPQNPAGNPGINDMIAFWTEADKVAGKLAPGSEDHPTLNAEGSRARVFSILDRHVEPGLYSPHYLQNVDPQSIRNADAGKLSPVNKSREEVKDNSTKRPE